MPKGQQEKSARRTRRASPSQKAIEAGQANLAKGRESRQRKREEAAGRDTAGERWAKLLDGTITVEDLDDDEISAMRVKGKDGVINRGRKMPSHLAQQFKSEAIKRAIDKFRMAAPEAVEGLLAIAGDPEAKHADRIKAYSIILERSLGRTPQEIRIEGADRWGSVLDAGVDLGDLDRDLADLADGTGSRRMGDESSTA